MCLLSISEADTQRYKNKKKTIIAYKVVIDGEDGIYPPYCSTDTPYEIGENIAKGSKIYYEHNGNHKDIRTYRSGFHCYLSKKIVFYPCDYKNYALIKVYIEPKDVICVGKESNFKVLVAKRIKIKSAESIADLSTKESPMW